MRISSVSSNVTWLCNGEASSLHSTGFWTGVFVYESKWYRLKPRLAYRYLLKTQNKTTSSYLLLWRVVFGCVPTFHQDSPDDGGSTASEKLAHSQNTRHNNAEDNLQSIDHELIPHGMRVLAAMQGSASGSTVRYYPTWKQFPPKERDEQRCYNAYN
jgi:hypothetical protein